MTGADVMRVLRQNIWLILILGVLGCAGGYGAFVYLDKHHRTYTAEGKVIVEEEPIFDPAGDIRQQQAARPVELETLLQNQVLLLSGPMPASIVLQQADSRTANNPWLREAALVDGVFNSDEAKEVILDNFSANAVKQSNFINVSMTAATPEGAKEILEELVNAHIAEQRKREYGAQEQQIRLLDRSASSLELEVQDLRNKVSRLAAKLRESGSEVAGSGASLMQMELRDLAGKRIESEAMVKALEDRFNSIQQNIQMGIDPPMVEMLVEQDPQVLQFRAALDQLDLEVEQTEVYYGKNSAPYQDIVHRRNLTQGKLEEKQAEVRARAQAQVVSQLKTELDAAKGEFDRTEQRIAELNEQLKEVDAELAELIATREELRVKSERLEAIIAQRDSIRFALNNQDRAKVNWGERPLPPTSPSFPQLIPTVAGGMLLGLGLALGLAFLREVLDNSVRSPRDVARVGQMNLLGMIPDRADDPQANTKQLGLVIAQAPHSMTAEQFRAVRSRLGHVAPLETTRTILVTSPGPGDGKTTVACNLAAGMALNGRKILLVDANFRRPELHKVFGLDMGPGLSSVLDNIGHFESAVAAAPGVPNLDILPAGSKPANPTELLESQPFIELIDRALEEYDHVIFDSGPVLFVSETGAMAPQVDGVISVVRAKANSRGLLGRMRDSLKSLNAEHLGVVLNAVRSQAGGYYNRNIKTYYAYQNGK